MFQFHNSSLQHYKIVVEHLPQNVNLDVLDEDLPCPCLLHVMLQHCSEHRRSKYYDLINEQDMSKM